MRCVAQCCICFPPPHVAETHPGSLPPPQNWEVTGMQQCTMTWSEGSWACWLPQAARSSGMAVPTLDTHGGHVPWRRPRQFPNVRR